MSDDWDTVTKIGSKTGGGSSQRETVVRGKGAINQAQRSGAIIGTEKKFATGNASNKSGSEGQRLTKVDRADDIIAPNKVPAEIGQNIRNRRSKEGPYKMTQAQLAQKVNAPAKDIQTLESGDAIKNQALLNKVARVLKISPKTGLPLDDK
ncbi:MAG: multiprotein-bridging factor 1 [Alectoria fallacina]|uniref:Multiprotein-bridging factor 1 n=1 Tax=Alectoria fallacina TaxID=1903189 RepID=A0A8H3IND5_9LECA|nr:MAG: multiprotein-bridging factor 1 [Alectoria sarmentosa]CAD6582884.1 MAG: multiprotein-bridging factor 1 [Alectoria sarmentosa]CAF9920049.1 MAG: multiprotein-bridging factor 1 [Alectoria fallacina]